MDFLSQHPPRSQSLSFTLSQVAQNSSLQTINYHKLNNSSELIDDLRKLAAKQMADSTDDSSEEGSMANNDSYKTENPDQSALGQPCSFNSLMETTEDEIIYFESEICELEISVEKTLHTTRANISSRVEAEELGQQQEEYCGHNNRQLFRKQISTYTPTPEQIAALYREAVEQRMLKERREAKKENPGLSPKYKAQLKKLKVSKTSQSCSICQQAFEKDELIVQLPCKHIFHKKNCIGEWLKRSKQCPLCKLNVEEHFQKQQQQDLNTGCVKQNVKPLASDSKKKQELAAVEQQLGRFPFMQPRQQSK